MRVRKLHVISAVVAIVFFVVGFFSFTYFFKNSSSSPELPTVSTDSTEEDDELVLNPNDPPITPFRELHEAILSLPAPDASDEARLTYRALIENNARQQNNVTIRECSPEPLVIKVESGSGITITNSDEIERLITVNDENKVTVPAKGTAKIKADFGKGNGIYSYRCGDDEAPAGIFLVKGQL